MVIPSVIERKPIRHLDYCTHIQYNEDEDILTRKLFDVNMRLFRANGYYRRLVTDVCNYIEFCCVTEKEGYKKPHGWSGANAGIPWNIIGVNISEHNTLIMINPKIIDWSKHNIRTVKSNCGSLTLDEPVDTSRWNRVQVQWWDRRGRVEPNTEWFGPTPGFTIQHEIDHNLGKLIK